MPQYKIEKDFKDFSQPMNKGYFYANPNKNLNPYDRELYPIVWKGIINDNDFEIHLNNSDSFSIESYEFVKFPNLEESNKKQIVKWIHECMNNEMD